MSPSPSASPGPFCFGFTADYDLGSNRLFERHLHAETRSHLYNTSGYDSDDRLTQYQRGSITSSGGTPPTYSINQAIMLPGTDQSRNWNLSLNGNWDSVAITPASGSATTDTRTHNALNQVTAFGSSGGTTVHYDKGNGSDETVGNGNVTDDGTRLYTYDALNRVVSVKKSDGCPIAAYYYDAGGRRVRKVSKNCGITGDAENSTIDFCLFGARVLEERDGDPDNQRRQYVWGMYVDELLQRRELKPTSTDYYPLADLHYRTVALTDANKRVKEAYDTDAYGRTQVYDCSATGRFFTDNDRTTNRPLCRYVYTGRELDPETQLYYYRARYYNTDLGRFVSRDPIGYGGGMNLYGYVGGRATRALDPLGLYDIDFHYYVI